jgi:succinate dehydrogenase / fumarate reductase iron-sulfur subunit
VESIARDMLAPFSRSGGENPYAIQADLQDTMQSLVGLIRNEHELREALKRIESLKQRAARTHVDGGRTYNPGLAHGARSDIAPHGRGMLQPWQRSSGARAAAATRETIIPYTDDSWGKINVVIRQRQGALGLSREPLARDAGGAQSALPGEEVAMAQFTMRVFRGDASGGGLKDYTVRARGGHGRPGRDPQDPGDAGPGPGLPVELQGRQVRLVQRRGQRQAASHVHDPDGPVQPGETITVTPIRTFPLIRDLVTDVSYNYEKAKQVPPLRLKPPEADGTYRMMQEDIDRIQEFHKCIECFLCQDVCHVIRDHEDKKRAFAGPRYFIKLASLDMHPLDTRDRSSFIKDNAGVGLCNITKCCTEVCPEHIHITDNGIIPLKERAGRRAGPHRVAAAKVPGPEEPTGLISRP